MAEFPNQPTPHSRSHWIRRVFGSRRVLLIVAMVALLALVLLERSAHEAIQGLAGTIERVAAAHPVGAIVLVLGFSALSAILAFVSAAVIAPFLATTWGSPLAIFLLWTGWLLGGMLAYAIGRTLGRPVIRQLASPTLLARYEELVSQHAPFGLVLLFQLALPSEVPGYLLGLVRYPFTRFLLALALAELPYAIATVLLGAGIIERQIATVAGVGAAVLALSGWTYHVLHRRLRFGGKVEGR
jgi:uncharacterized membrane protein YdjX (TVP38/TMEM64 family)